MRDGSASIDPKNQPCWADHCFSLVGSRSVRATATRHAVLSSSRCQSRMPLKIFFDGLAFGIQTVEGQLCVTSAHVKLHRNLSISESCGGRKNETRATNTKGTPLVSWRRLPHVSVTSALPPIADIQWMSWHVRFVPLADIRRGQSISTASALIELLVAISCHALGYLANGLSWRTST